MDSVIPTTAKQSVIVRIDPRRGRSPARIYFDDGAEVSTFDPTHLRTAQKAVGKPVMYTIREKAGAGKHEGKTFVELMSLNVPPDAVEETPETPSVEPDVAPGSTIETLPAIPPQAAPESLPGRPLVPLRAKPVSPVPVIDPLARMEQGYALAKRRHELIIQLLKERFSEGIHYMDGKTFGSDKPVLLQPGAHAIFQVCGFACNPVVISGPLSAPEDDGAPYTIVVRAEITDAEGRFVGSQMGSCSSHIYSSRQGGEVLRAVDRDKSHNSCLKMATKRATVAACRQTTPASEIFREDIEELGYTPKGDDAAPEDAPRGRFFKRTRR